MDRSLVIGLASFALTASLLAIPAVASEEGAGQAGASMSREQMESRLAERFAAADTDGSGMIDRSEAEARNAARRADRQARRFARMDTNDDGEISIAERDTLRSGRRGSLRDRMIVENRNMRGQVTPEMQAQLQPGSPQTDSSADRPNAANRAERRNAAWAAADADSNGALSRSEYDSMANTRHQRRAARGSRLFDRADTNDDGLLSLEEISAGPLAMFERADADNDGLVTRAERRAARRAMREQRRSRQQ